MSLINAREVVAPKERMLLRALSHRLYACADRTLGCASHHQSVSHPSHATHHVTHHACSARNMTDSAFPLIAPSILSVGCVLRQFVPCEADNLSSLEQARSDASEHSLFVFYSFGRSVAKLIDLPCRGACVIFLPALLQSACSKLT